MDDSYTDNEKEIDELIDDLDDETRKEMTRYFGQKRKEAFREEIVENRTKDL